MVTACSSTEDTPETFSDTVGTTAETVPINTEPLTSEQQEKVNEVADSLTGELENKTIKWMSFYDPWHPGTTGNTKPVSVELFEAQYGGEIEYYPTTWDSRFNDISTSVLGGEGIDFIAGGDLDSFPKGLQSGMAESFDSYVDWDNPLWKSVSDINADFERAMNFQYDLAKSGLVLDKSAFGWNTHIEFMGTGNELFYISGLYEIQQSSDIWTKTFGEAEDVMFVPIPRDEAEDKYYLGRIYALQGCAKSRRRCKIYGVYNRFL